MASGEWLRFDLATLVPGGPSSTLRSCFVYTKNESVIEHLDPRGFKLHISEDEVNTTGPQELPQGIQLYYQAKDAREYEELAAQYLSVISDEAAKETFKKVYQSMKGNRVVIWHRKYRGAAIEAKVFAKNPIRTIQAIRDNQEIIGSQTAFQLNDSTGNHNIYYAIKDDLCKFASTQSDSVISIDGLSNAVVFLNDKAILRHDKSDGSYELDILPHLPSLKGIIKRRANIGTENTKAQKHAKLVSAALAPLNRLTEAREKIMHEMIRKYITGEWIYKTLNLKGGYSTVNQLIKPGFKRKDVRKKILQSKRLRRIVINHIQTAIRSCHKYIRLVCIYSKKSGGWYWKQHSYYYRNAIPSGDSSWRAVYKLYKIEEIKLPPEYEPFKGFTKRQIAEIMDPTLEIDLVQKGSKYIWKYKKKPELKTNQNRSTLQPSPSKASAPA